MDPQTCLYELLESLLDGDRDFALAHLDALREWIAKDGFLPTVIYIDDADARAEHAMLCVKSKA